MPVAAGLASVGYQTVETAAAGVLLGTAAGTEPAGYLEERGVYCTGGWSKALLALLAPLKVWHLTKFWDDRG